MMKDSAFLVRLLSTGGIAGLIALMITIAICVRYVGYGEKEFPQILTYALSTIIGFYFGAGVESGVSGNQAHIGGATTPKPN